MKLKRIISKKTNRVGYRGRYTDPLSGKRMQKTFWFAERTDAEDAYRALISKRSRREYNLPDTLDGWKLRYADVVKRFIKEADIASEQRRERLSVFLNSNPLKLDICGDFSGRGSLNAKCGALAKVKGAAFVQKCVQQPLKQLAAWAAECDLIPYDPLAGWKALKRQDLRRKKHAFTPEEMRAVFTASDELDALGNCAFALSIVFRTLLVTGNRPSAVVASKVGDLKSNRIDLGPGRGKKHNGKATIPPPFVGELQRYLLHRGRPAADKPLLISQSGCALDVRNLSEAFRRAAALAFVKMNWPMNEPRAQFVTPLQVSISILKGRLYRFDGPEPTKDAKKEARAQRIAALTGLVEMLKAPTEKWLAEHPLYCLRHTHITWARRFANFDAVRAQVGHAGRNIEETHYNDENFVEAGQSSQAVWDVLVGAKTLQREAQTVVLTEAVGQVAPVVETIENTGQVVTVVATGTDIRQKTRKESAKKVSEVFDMIGTCESSPSGTVFVAILCHGWALGRGLLLFQRLSFCGRRDIATA